MYKTISTLPCTAFQGFCLAACIGGTTLALAQQPEDVALAAPMSLSSLAVQEPLSMKAVVALALENNGDIKSADLGKLIQRERIKSEMLAFDLQMNASYLFQYIDSPQNSQDYISTGGGTVSPFNPAQPLLTEPTIFKQRNHIGKFGVTQKLQTGTILELGTTMRVLDNSLNRRRPPAVYHKEWESFTGLTVTHPLWRDGGRDAATAKVRVAKANSKIADLEWELQTTQVVAGVMKRYYDVLFTLENLKVQRESIALAQKLLKDTRARNEEGQVSANEVATAEAGVYRRMEDALAAEMQYIERQNALQLLFKKPEQVIASSSRIVPVDRMSSMLPRVDRRTLVNTALDRRQEIKQADQLIVAKNAEFDHADSQARPRLDLVGSFGLHGLSGDMPRTYREAGSFQGPEFTAGVQFSMPFGEDNLEAQRRAAKHEQTQAMVKRGDARIRVALEVDTVISRLQADRLRIDATRKSREAAALSAEAGLKRLNEGVMTSFEVLQLQKEFAQARSREIAAITDLNKNIVDLQMATGTLLEKQGLNLVASNSVGKEIENVSLIRILPENGSDVEDSEVASKIVEEKRSKRAPGIRSKPRY